MLAKSKENSTALGAAKIQGGVHNLFARRRAERWNFLSSLRGPDIPRDCEDIEYFRALVSLAIEDYGVNRRSLGALLGVSEAAISRWIGGKSKPPAYARPQIVLMIASLLEASLQAEDRGDEEPVPLMPEEAGAEQIRNQG